MPAARQLRYTTPWRKTVEELKATFTRWGVGAHLWSIEAPSDRWRSWDRALGKEDRVVSLRFPFNEREILLTCDAQETPAGNLRVLFMAVESMRLNEVRGLSDVMREAYLQLEAPEVTRDPYEVLGVRPDTDIDIIEAVYKAQAKRTHPDAGGTDEAFKEVAAAWGRVKADRGVTA